ncbi:DNA/RNA-binding winged helix domain-containing protein [Microbacterium sp. CFBP 8794]|uniref:DNA/RNA-binding winged helix domain-containing protein n=1 Tax=Microbacterium sp. CFBP 8794 TaxID=2775269 RepID=UPI003F885457
MEGAGAGAAQLRRVLRPRLPRRAAAALLDRLVGDGTLAAHPRGSRLAPARPAPDPALGRGNPARRHGCRARGGLEHRGRAGARGGDLGHRAAGVLARRHPGHALERRGAAARDHLVAADRGRTGPDAPSKAHRPGWMPRGSRPTRASPSSRPRSPSSATSRACVTCPPARWD